METHKEKPVESKSGSSIQTAPSWTWRILILIFIILCLSGWMVSCNWEKTDDSTTNSNTPEVSYKEVLELMDYGYVGNNKTEWITPKVNYKFKLRSEGHAYFVQFSTENGGWTKKILIPAEGDMDITIPSEATQGVLRITPGPNETREFRVQLYRKRNIKN